MWSLLTSQLSIAIVVPDLVDHHANTPEWVQTPAALIF
jgi:hypothetical protein